MDHIAARRRLESLLGIPATEGNAIDVLRNGVEIFPAMLEAISEAQRSIDLLTFIYWKGDVARQFADALSERARAGVRVRVLLDGVGARNLTQAIVDEMCANGCDVRWFRPIDTGHLGEVNRRTHRKVMICDETLSFTGGVGIADEWDGDARDETEWRDTHFRVRGPATDGLRAAFLHDWSETGDDVIFDPTVDLFPPQPSPGRSVVQVVRGASETGTNDIAQLMGILVASAEQRLRITTAYFTPDDYLVERLVDAARRGVEVEVLVPGPHADKRFVQLGGEAVFEPLLAAGVVVRAFQPSMLHTKVLTVDASVAAVGSANVNRRSTHFDDEVDLVILDPEVVAILDGHYEDDVERSEDLDPSRWADRGLFQRAKEQAIDTMSDLL